MKNFLFSTAGQRVWDFLCRNPQESFYSAQVAQRTGLSAGGTNEVLRTLAKQGLVQVEKKGRMAFYRVDIRLPLIKQFKLLRNLALAEELIKKIKVYSEKIVLFGSCMKGEDTAESDIDVFIVGRNKEEIRKKMPQVKEGRNVQLVLKTPQEYLLMESEEPVFYKEIQGGMVLWQKES